MKLAPGIVNQKTKIKKLAYQECTCMSSEALCNKLQNLIRNRAKYSKSSKNKRACRKLNLTHPE